MTTDTFAAASCRMHRLGRWRMRCGASLCVFVVTLLFTRICAGQSAPTSRPHLWSLSYNKICGPYSVGVVTRLYGRRHPFDKLCELTGFDPERGASAAGLIRAIESCGLNAVLVRCSPTACDGFEVPMIVCLRNSEPKEGEPEKHFAAIVPDDGNPGRKLVVLTKGARRVDIAKLASTGWWTGDVILVSDASFRYGWDLCRTLVYLGMGVGGGILISVLFVCVMRKIL